MSSIYLDARAVTQALEKAGLVFVNDDRKIGVAVESREQEIMNPQPNPLKTGFSVTWKVFGVPHESVSC